MNLFKSIVNIGVYPNQDLADIKMVRTVNLLAANAFVCVNAKIYYNLSLYVADNGLSFSLILPFK